ncbi:ATP-binding protein [Streptomyces sp. WMMC940]|uniref:ATP-binding protein n=1 Tax=Streptomyces sp. WMMC940 TaxID=3015153 RepID=UPI0022B66314|nr:ATP-binding protein [Streptomyces sp. WMMC940]MCZ7456258.1 ATP-binding protein [Streptomyces sp. WMMC940]
MGQAAGNQNWPVDHGHVSVSETFEGGEGIGAARDLARSFLTRLQVAHGVRVSGHTIGAVELVVSELVTNARKFAPGPCLLSLEYKHHAVHVSVWDGNPCLPVIRGPDPARVGHHGLEIVMAVSESLQFHEDPVGKRITSTITLSDDRRDDGGDGRA